MKSPAFAFRCSWQDEYGNPDGYTYAIRKDYLVSEMARRKRLCRDKPSTPEVVMVNAELVSDILKQSSQCFSTISEFHPGDLVQIA